MLGRQTIFFNKKLFTIFRETPEFPIKNLNGAAYSSGKVSEKMEIVRCILVYSSFSIQPEMAINNPEPFVKTTLACPTPIGGVLSLHKYFDVSLYVRRI